MARSPKYKKFTSLNDLLQRSQAGDDRAQRICIAALRNLGCEHLATRRRGDSDPEWRLSWDGLQSYVSALVGEYGMSETRAFRDTLAEVNNVIDCVPAEQPAAAK